MFADPFSAVMALILLAFVGTLAVFFRIWRELDSVRRALGEVRENLEYYVVDVDQQNRELAEMIAELRRLTGSHAGAAREGANETLGALLDKGLPNLVGNPAFGGTPKADFGHAAASALPENDEEDLLRRLRPVPANGSEAR